MTQLATLGELVADGRVWRMRELIERGITAATVRRAVAAGAVEAVSRGVYRRAGDPIPSVETQLAEALIRIPKGLVCLHSAAMLHGMGDVAPVRVWVAIPNKTKPPRVDWPPMRFVQWRSEAAFTVGVEERLYAGVRVRLTDPARTVIDMLRHPDLVGEERGIACLRDFLLKGGVVGDLRVTAAQLGVGKRLSTHLKVAAHLGGPL